MYITGAATEPPYKAGGLLLLNSLLRYCFTTVRYPASLTSPRCPFSRLQLPRRICRELEVPHLNDGLVPSRQSYHYRVPNIDYAPDHIRSSSNLDHWSPVLLVDHVQVPEADFATCAAGEDVSAVEDNEG